VGPQTLASFAVLLVCFFFSGATALVYEVVWLRMLGLIFGHTVYALTTVLAAVMAGLGLGAFLFGRARPFRDPIRIYGVLELGIGVYCALIPGLVFPLVSPLYLALHRLLGLSYGAFSFVQFLLLFSFLLVPTTLMGGTLPLLSQALVKREGSITRIVGTLYSLNTLGAVVGATLAGYGLIPAFGNRTTLWLAAALNLAIGLAAIEYARRLGGSTAVEATRRSERSASPQAASASRAAGRLAPIILAAFGVSGAASMVYEVAWTRALSLVVGSSTYAFTAMLVAFLLGIAGGAALYSWLWGTRRASLAAFAGLQAGIGLAAMALLLSFERTPELFVAAFAWSDSSTLVQSLQFLVSAGALLPSTLLIGATFPCAVALAARSATRVAADVGRLYGANTLGAVAGTILAGFVLIPAVGVHRSIQLAISTNLLMAGALWMISNDTAPARRWGVAAAAVVIAAGVFFIPHWDQRVMSSGPAIYPHMYLQASKASDIGAALRGMEVGMEVVFYRDGPSATVAVTRVGENVVLRINGKADASTQMDVPTQLMLGHLPLLLHPHPLTVLVIGLGSGMTAGAVAQYPIEHLDIVEIEPAVIEASRFFTQQNGDVLKDPRVRTLIADARNYLLTTSDRYDLIISEPSNPWIGGIASLFSREFFELARQRLKPGGVMVQWVQGYSLAPEDLQMIVKTFRTSFPATSVWRVAVGDYLLLGKTQPAPIEIALLKDRYLTNPAIKHDLEVVGLRDWTAIFGDFMLGEADAARYSDDAEVNADDRLPLEFSAPRALYTDTMAANFELMRRFRVVELPEFIPDTRGEADSKH
jgi:spermidine synthase